MKTKKYTKTQLKKDQVAAVIDILQHEFDAQIDDADGGRFDVVINGFQGQFSRRDLEVMFNESIKLYRPELFDDEFVCSLHFDLIFILYCKQNIKINVFISNQQAENKF